MLPYKIPSSRVVKVTARAALKSRWVEAILASFTGMFSVLICTICFSLAVYSENSIMIAISAAIIVAMAIFILAPLFLGILRYFWRLTNSLDDDLSAVFYFFAEGKSYRRALNLTFIIGWRIVTAAVVCMLPYAIASALSGDRLYLLIGQEIPLWAPNLMLIRTFLYVVGIICAVLYISRYYLVPVLVVMNDDMLLLEAVHTSSMVAKRSSSAFLRLAFSCIGWIILTNLILPALYTLPFIIACYAVHSRFAMANYNLILDYYENNLTGYYQ